MELLAPAGGPEQAQVALHFGADALYLSGKRWGMRAGARNFDDEELAEVVDLSHRAGARVHVAANVVIRDDELSELSRWFSLLGDIGVDAAIVADLGALALLREHAPQVEAHLSTQASVTNARSADTYARLGVRRIVLAREMTLTQIAELRRGCTHELELEVFAHGSMCMAYSGRCLLSASLVGPERSASRGACTQPCRWSWSLVEQRDPSLSLDLDQDGHGSYLLSSNDLCLIEHLDELRDAGVDAIKLEGRAKGSYYVGCVTNAYRHVLDGDAVEPWREELDLVSHRPYSTGFLFGSPTQNPGRVDYARERMMVAVVRGCTCRQDSWRVTVTCRNKAPEGSVLQVLAPRQPVRTLPLTGLTVLDPDGGSQDARDLARNGALYQLDAPFPLAPGDLLCIPAKVPHA